MPPPKSKGRQKIQMKRMTKESNLMVTFSKRRSGLFKKASELCTLCGVEIAIIVFSPGKKVFSFGHPCVESIVDRYLTQNPAPSSSTSQLVEAHRSANVRDLNMQLTHLLNQLEVEKKRNEELSKIRKASQENYWWESPVENMGLQELGQLKVAMEELKKNVVKQAERQMVAAHPMPIFPVSGGPRAVSGGSNVDVNGFGLGLSMTPHGFVLGYGHQSF